ncbi:MAG: DUF1828 domain-containing protein [Chloroflexi bacterium]|nr:DUF1828 domain-containing protein [Chloroflexota bacterium]MCL5274473.1 DUF1828 domain-containing protein [Chloroflexota bacterium]
MNYLDQLRKDFNNRVSFREKLPGIMQLVAPLYHEDGDMMDIFLQPIMDPNGQTRIRVSDYGMTLMRLSYSYEVDTPNKERILEKILNENQVSESNGNLYLDASPDGLYPAVMQLAQTSAKISNMRLYKREVIQSMFYELLDEYIQTRLKAFHPTAKVYPIPARDDLEVDYRFDLAIPVLLFAVKDEAKARLTTISCLEFRNANMRFKSFVVHDNFDDLARKDRNRITSVADKQFISLENFQDNAQRVFALEAQR